MYKSSVTYWVNLSKRKGMEGFDGNQEAGGRRASQEGDGGAASPWLPWLGHTIGSWKLKYLMLQG